jgi:hypothetical protein
MIKAYVNCYSEISHLPVDEQESLLEKARYEAFVQLKPSGLSALYLFGSLLLFFLPFALSIVFFGAFLIPTLLLFVVFLIGQSLLNKYLQGKLIRKGLRSILLDSDV